ncbi:hypothetical protein MPH_09956 [Macrophomina phaseolina MS6]|uniref:Uncharacterized protein n=1 Tax=Macrophomina phaseolina (strain MS6) TaxID=1126212 RepID=K2RRQ0_MACPH|nr:hypothetical protein MPH_09956 [Macrophomina phaseolina MS6]
MRNLSRPQKWRIKSGVGKGAVDVSGLDTDSRSDASWMERLQTNPLRIVKRTAPRVLRSSDRPRSPRTTVRKGQPVTVNRKISSLCYMGAIFDRTESGRGPRPMTKAFHPCVRWRSGISAGRASAFGWRTRRVI